MPRARHIVNRDLPVGLQNVQNLGDLVFDDFDETGNLGGGRTIEQSQNTNKPSKLLSKEEDSLDFKHQFKAFPKYLKDTYKQMLDSDDDEEEHLLCEE